MGPPRASEKPEPIAIERWVDSWLKPGPGRGQPLLASPDDDSLFGAWPRPEMAATPLVLMHLQGLIGDVYPERTWPPVGSTLHLRPGVVPMVRALREDAQVAFIGRRGALATLVLRELRKRGCSIDAVFETSGSRHSLDVREACARFGIPLHEAAARVLVVGAIALSHDDIEAREGAALLGTESALARAVGSVTGASFQPLFVPSLPLPTTPAAEAPLLLLLPDPRAEPTGRAVHCRLLLELLRELLIVGAGAGGWPASLAALAREDVKTLRYALHTPRPPPPPPPPPLDGIGGGELGAGGRGGSGAGGGDGVAAAVAVRSGAAILLRGACVGMADLCDVETLPARHDLTALTVTLGGFG